VPGAGKENGAFSGAGVTDRYFPVRSKVTRPSNVLNDMA
jgi:hypothetical protein